MKRHIRCKLLAAILLVTLLAGDMELSGVFAEKDEGTEMAVPGSEEPVTSDAPAVSSLYEAAAYANDHSHTTALSSSGATLSSGGNYYLSDNITASSQFILTSGSANICLNGKTVSSDVSNGLFRAESSTLNIYDCAGGGIDNSIGAHNPVYLASGNLNLYGGTLKSESRVAIATSGDGTIHIYGGTVQGGSNGINVGTSTQKYDIYISGGSICKGSDSSYAVNNKGTGTIHLSGNPTFTGGIYTTTAIVIDGTYSGGSAAIDWAGGTSAGTVVVQGGAAYADKFTVSNSPGGYKLLPSGNDLVLDTEIVVTLNANGGTVSQVNMSVASQGTYGTLPTPTRKGYTFRGWYTTASGSV